MDFGAALVCLALIATLPMSLSNPTPLLSEDDEEVLLSESVAVVDYQDPPPHYRPVREHDPANDFDSALSARAGPPPLMSLSGKRNDLLATMYLSVDRDHDCQPMSRKAARMCAQFGYNMTRVPNLLNHQTQVEAYQQLVGYKELLRSNCAQDLLFLLCSYHLPSCQGTRKQIMTETTSVGDVALVTPCRGLCERVRDSCLPLLQRYGYDWPWSMQCDRLQTEPLMTEPQSRQLVACVNTPPPKQAGDSTAPEEAVTEQPAPEQETHPVCQPRNCPSQKVKRRVFKEFNYDWVIEGRYLGMIVKDRKHSLQVRVKNVIYKSTASPRRLKVGRELIILTDQPESVCGGCPNLHAMNTTYVMAGFSRGSQLVYRVNQGIALQTERSYASRIAKWLRKLYKST